MRAKSPGIVSMIGGNAKHTFEEINVQSKSLADYYPYKLSSFLQESIFHIEALNHKVFQINKLMCDFSFESHKATELENVVILKSGKSINEVLEIELSGTIIFSIKDQEGNDLFFKGHWDHQQRDVTQWEMISEEQYAQEKGNILQKVAE